MTQVAVDLSNSLAAAVERAAAAVVRVDGRRRGPSTGVVCRTEGLIVTAHHTLEWQEGIEVTLPEGASASATLVGFDPSTDLALLRAAASGLAVADWSPSAPRPGQLVLAIARGERGPRAVHGVVSATGGPWRPWLGGRIDAYLETDLAPFAGYSGSLLVDVSGLALGVNTTGVLRGTGVALPPATVQRVVEKLLAHGYVSRGFLGIGTVPVRLAPDQAGGQEAGLIVTSVQADTPAARAGMMLGDVLLTFDGHALRRPHDLLARLDDESVGRTAALRVLRAGEERELAVNVGARERSAS